MKKLNNILASIFKIDEAQLTDELSMKSVAMWDSLKHMELISVIEDELKIALTAEDIIQMVNIKSIREIVVRKTQL
jgi:acyl carrier protein|tara:strand:- start:2485 stop:2712 length:228 start_codon:yes stop_codon:yes gene_type:complete